MPRILHNPDVLWRRESDEVAPDQQEEAVAAILFSGGSMLSLNEFGIEVWQKCDGRTLDELVAMLLPEYEVEEEMLRTDISEFLGTLAQKGFIRYE